jgi:hypothetical protein
MTAGAVLAWGTGGAGGLFALLYLLYVTTKIMSYAWHAGKKRFEDDNFNGRPAWRRRDGNASGSR